MTSREARKLVGKKIARVRLNPWPAGGGWGTNHEPEIVFTDGTILRFHVQESEDCDYGVDLVYPARPVRP